MSKIILLSLSTPTRENFRAASALPYHLMLGAREAVGEEGAAFEVYSFDINEVPGEKIAETERELGCKIHLLPRPKWQSLMFRLHLLPLRVLLRRPLMSYCRIPARVVSEIRFAKPDAVWIYGEELMGLAGLFGGTPCTLTMPDCEAMYYHRLLRKRFATRTFWQILRYAYAYWQYRAMERDFFNTAVRYHFVGKADCEFFREINPRANAVFLPHPLYSASGKQGDANSRKFHSPIRLLIAGRHDIYQREAADEAVAAMAAGECADLRAGFAVTFLGKGWEGPAGRLREAGWAAEVKAWVDDYAEELRQHDVELALVSVGTGTKGKVLDAFAAGLLVVGTPFALENIAVGDACIRVSSGAECISALRQILSDTARYESMAAEGCSLVCQKHSREYIAKMLLQ